MSDLAVLGESIKSALGAAVTWAIGTVLQKRWPLGLRKEDADLKALLDKGIADIRANGTYKTINDKYFAFDAYGD